MGLKTFHTSHGLLIAAAVTRQKPIRAQHHAQKMNSQFRELSAVLQNCGKYFSASGPSGHHSRSSSP